MKNINYKRIRRKIHGVQTIRVVSRAMRKKLKGKPKEVISVPNLENHVSNLADILHDFVEVEKEKYNQFKFNHNPTLGAMYEALTENIVDRMLPPNLGLKMVGGFIYDDNDFISGEIDRMLVKGEGQQIGLTDKYQYHIKDVLIIFEVKKTLNKAAFVDAYEHLSGVSKAFSEYFEDEVEKGYEPNISYAAQSFAQITGKPEPTKYSDVNKMDPEDGFIFYTLVQDTYSPIKIIHGYGGYKTESGLRNVFVDFLEERQRGHGFGTPSMPNLISSETYSISKLTGMPFKTPRFDDGFWPIIGSSSDNVLQLMIELIWTKISISCNVSMPWGDDLQSEVMSTLLMGKFACSEDKTQAGWLYSEVDIKNSELQKIQNKVMWEPVIIDKMLMETAQFIGMLGGIELDSDFTQDHLKEWNISKEVFSKKIKETNLFSINHNGYIMFIGERLHLVQTDENEFAASDNVTRLEKWCELNDVRPAFISFLNTDRISC